MATRKTTKKTKKPTKKSRVVSSSNTANSLSGRWPLGNNKITTSSLNKLNIVVVAALFVQAVVLLVISKSFSLPVVTHYLTVDSLASKAAGHTVWAAAARHLFDVNIALLLAMILLAGTVFYGLSAVWLRKRYENDLKAKSNRLRWFNFGLAGGLSLVTIGLLNGVYDAALLMALFSLVALNALFAIVLETYNSKRQFANWVINSFAFFVWLMPWLILDAYLKGAIIYGQGLSHYIYWLNGSIFVLFAASALNMFMTSKAKGRWSNYLFSEWTYVVLGFVTSTALVWQIFFGTLR